MCSRKVVARAQHDRPRQGPHRQGGGLRADPAKVYWYRFRLGGTTPPSAAPAPPGPTTRPRQMHFGVVTCSNLEAGYFSAYRHLAARADLDAILHLGDYIYEYGPASTGREIRRSHVTPRQGDLQPCRLPDPARAVQDRPGSAGAARGVPSHRHLGRPRVRQRRLVRGRREPHRRRGRWAAASVAAKQAYFEWMPVRPAIEGTTYRRLRFGKLADLSCSTCARTGRSR